MNEHDFVNLEARVKALEERNRRVEAEKAWETSSFRVGTLTVITYAIASFLLSAIGSVRPFLDALIPAVGFFLSTQSLPFIKRWWIGKHS